MGQQDFSDDWQENYNTGKYLLEEAGQAENAIVFLSKAYEQVKQDSENIPEISAIAFELGNAYFKAQDYESSLEAFNKTVEYANFHKNDSLHIEGNMKAAECTKRTLAYEDGLKALKENEEIIRSYYGEKSEKYASNLRLQSDLYKVIPEYPQALKYGQEAIQIIESIHGHGSSNSANYKTSLSQIHHRMGDYPKALSMVNQALGSLELKNKEDSLKFGAVLFTKALYLEKIRDFDAAIIQYKPLQNIFERDSAAYLMVLQNLGQLYADSGDYQAAFEYQTECINKTNPNNVLSYAERLENLGYLYMKLGDYENSRNYYEKALQVLVKNGKETHESYGKLLNNIGKMHRQLADHQQAEIYFKQALDIFLEHHEKDHIRYGYQVNDLANTLMDGGKHEQALALFEENLKLSSTNNEKSSQEHSNWQFNLASAYNRLGLYDKAMPLALEASENTRQLLGKDHVIYGRMLKGLGHAYLGLEDYGNATKHIVGSNAIFINEVDKVFRFRSENERRSFLTVVQDEFDENQSLSYYAGNSAENMNALNLNNQMLFKGLLLNSSKDLISELQVLDDAEINSSIQIYRRLKYLVENEISKPWDERAFDIDSLKSALNAQEAELVTAHSRHYDKGLDFNVDWQQSKARLQEDEVAIEFANFRLFKNGLPTDKYLYVAYVFDASAEHPKVVRLFEEDQLASIIKKYNVSELYRRSELYNLIWSPIRDAVDLPKRIYYSPSGLLNQISIAALKNQEGVLCHQHDLIQMSNTAILKDGLNEPQSASYHFIGGVNYDALEEVEIKEQPQDTSEDLMSTLVRGKATRNRGESWTFLPGSLAEVEQLKGLLNKEENTVVLSTGIHASETMIKSLSGNSPHVLHIATHGFFYENRDDKPFHSAGLSTEDRYRLAEDPLLRSGLILAGANYAWKHGSNPNAKDDGILTAMEIANLDLSNTELVVLSACETGLGDIDGSEGVYGLQRAFKKAGVQLIIMSLWQVPDKETSEFMNAFYSEWLESNNIRNAFNKAQRLMQSKYPEDPVKWAAFVLFE